MRRRFAPQALWRPGLLAALLGAPALTGCGDDPLPRDAQPLIRPAPRQSAGADVVGAAAGRLEASLAGLRGEAAQAYARELLARALPEDEGKRREILCNALQTGSETERWIALLAVPDAGPWNDELFRAVLRQTQATLGHVRSAALAALRAGQAFDAAAVERMWRVVGTAEPELQSALLYALGRVRQDVTRKPDMLAALAHGNAEVRAAAAFSLSQLDLSSAAKPWPHTDVRTAFEAALTDENLQVRWWALLAFPRMGAHAAPAAAHIAPLLFSPAPRIQSAATTALITLGSPATQVLAPMVAQATRFEIEALAYVLQRLGSTKALEALRRGLSHADPYIQVRVAMALRARGAADLDAPARFARALEHDDAEVVLLALEGLGQSGPASAPYLSQIEPLRRHKSPDVRRAAAVLTDLLNR